MPAAGVKLIPIAGGKLRRYFSWRNVLSPFQIVLGFGQAFLHLRRVRPQVVFSTGGYVALPVVAAAAFLRIPIVVHEQTAVMGLANRFAARLARRVLLTYPETEGIPDRIETEVVGNPVRPSLFAADRTKALGDLGLTDSLPVVCVMGGAQGAHYLNEAVRLHLPDLLSQLQLIVITGPNADYEALQAATTTLAPELGHRLKLYPLVKTLLSAVYAASDLVVSRAGAGTVNELRALHKPALLVPLPASAGGEQTRNAQYLARMGGAIVLSQAGTPMVELVSRILNLARDRVRLTALRQALAEQPGGNAAERILEILATTH